MADTPFPHLYFSYIGKLKAKFPSAWREEPAEVVAIRANPGNHATTLRGVLEGLEKDYRINLDQRRKDGLPLIEKGKGFLLRLREGVDADEIAHALNVELVAEAEGGFILVAAEDISFSKFYSALSLFEAGQDGGGRAAAVMQAFRKPDDQARLQQILAPDVFPSWPFEAKKEYTFDLSIQTAPSLRTVKFQRAVQRKHETLEAFAARKRAAHDVVLASAYDRWTEGAEERFLELERIVKHFKGTFLSGFSSDPEKPINNGVQFADCIVVRVRMCGEGFHDVIFNLPHLFEITLPEELRVNSGDTKAAGTGQPTIKSPAANAPAICVIDSGIEEGHAWLAPAIDTVASKCFLPGIDAKAVQDEVKAAGHGTRVAGAVLYPLEIPRAGEVTPVAWLQNARVLNADNRVPESLTPARYLTEAVNHAVASARSPKIFTHSIASGAACPLYRMTAWASKLDELSAALDILVVQAAGNLDEFGSAKNNPGIVDHRKAGREYPAYLLEDSCRIANPAQSLHALTVGAVPGAVFDNVDLKSFGESADHPASYSRTGWGMWNAIKPEVVEVGGDYCYEKGKVGPGFPRAEVSNELLCATFHGAPAFAKDGVGTSFAAPKVAHIAARIQSVFPDASPQLYRTLIVRSARWPAWAESHEKPDEVLRHIGFGKPDVVRATENSAHRITLITPDSVEIRNYDLHLYSIKIPGQLRAGAGDAKIRIEVTLSYTAEPRRTRRSRYGYLRTRVDWRSSGLGESLEEFRRRLLKEGRPRVYTQPKWMIHHQDRHGEAEETNRDRGTVQKDWALFEPHELASEVAIAVRAHNGWDHRKEEGLANYCLAVSFEIIGAEIPIYSLIAKAQAQVDAEVQAEIRIPAN